MIPPEHNGVVDPLTWIKRLTKASNIPQGHPLYAQAQADIPLMREMLLGAVDRARVSDSISNHADSANALNVGPAATAAGTALDDLDPSSWIMGLANKPGLVKSGLNAMAGGPALESSQEQNPTADWIGHGLAAGLPVAAGIGIATRRRVLRKGAIQLEELLGKRLNNELLRSKQKGSGLRNTLLENQPQNQAAQLKGRQLQNDLLERRLARDFGDESATLTVDPAYEPAGGFTPEQMARLRASRDATSTTRPTPPNVQRPTSTPPLAPTQTTTPPVNGAGTPGTGFTMNGQVQSPAQPNPLDALRELPDAALGQTPPLEQSALGPNARPLPNLLRSEPLPPRPPNQTVAPIPPAAPAAANPEDAPYMSPFFRDFMYGTPDPQAPSGELMNPIDLFPKAKMGNNRPTPEYPPFEESLMPNQLMGPGVAKSDIAKFIQSLKRASTGGY